MGEHYLDSAEMPGMERQIGEQVELVAQGGHAPATVVGSEQVSASYASCPTDRIHPLEPPMLNAHVMPRTARRVPELRGGQRLSPCR